MSLSSIKSETALRFRLVGGMKRRLIAIIRRSCSDLSVPASQVDSVFGSHRRMSDLPLSLVLGVGLAAATGFRVFLPMLIMSGAAYTGHLSLDDNFAWLGTPSA